MMTIGDDVSTDILNKKRPYSKKPPLIKRATVANISVDPPSPTSPGIPVVTSETLSSPRTKRSYQVKPKSTENIYFDVTGVEAMTPKFSGMTVDQRREFLRSHNVVDDFD